MEEHNTEEVPSQEDLDNTLHLQSQSLHSLTFKEEDPKLSSKSSVRNKKIKRRKLEKGVPCGGGGGG